MTIRQQSFGLAHLAVCAALALGGAAASANTPVTPQVNGSVSAGTGGTVIVVDGKRYLVAVNSPAFKQLSSLKPGQSVGLVLDGPASSSGSHVIYIQSATASK